MYKTIKMGKNLFLLMILMYLDLTAQVDNTMYGLYQILNPPSFQLASIDPMTGQISTIGSANLSNTVNATGASLNPYNQTYSYQDEDSWLTLSLQSGSIISDVALTLPNSSGYFNNFKFNTADSIMYGLYSQVIYDPITGISYGDLRLGTCDISSGVVNVISPNSVATSYTMSGSTIDPYLMVYYFITEDKFMGLDLYNGQIFSQPTISIPNGGSSFDNFAYSCADTSVYGLIMQNGVKALGKINPETGVVSALPTVLNFDNYVMNSGGAVDPIDLTYYFQTIDSLGQIKMVGLSLLDGSVVSQTNISSNGNYFIMYRIQNDCYEANPSRMNPNSSITEFEEKNVFIYPNPAQNVFNLNADFRLDRIELLDIYGNIIQQYQPEDSNIKVNIESFNKGIYYVRVTSNSLSMTIRLIKN
jgi:hypothetical protein